MNKRDRYSNFSRDFASSKNTEAINLFLKFLEKEKDYAKNNIEEVIEIVKNLEEKKSFNGSLPCNIFNVKELSSLEIIAKYIREEFSLSYHEIAVILNRDDRTIWSTYNNSLKKYNRKLEWQGSKYFIPVSIFKDRVFGVLELICEYLKDNFSLSYHDVAVIVNRNDRTVWTAYQRAKKRRLTAKLRR